MQRFTVQTRHKVAAILAAGLALASWLPARNVELQSALNLPLYFEANREAGATSFIARGSGRSISIAPDRMTLSLCKVETVEAPAPDKHGGTQIRTPVVTRSLSLEFVGANRDAEISGEGELPGRVNYFIGNQPADWRTGLSTFERVRVKSVYPGIDVVHYGNQRRLEYDFIVQPGARPDRIAMRARGADKLSVDSNGDLVMALGREQVRLQRPVIYQTIHGQRQDVSGGYQLRDSRTVGFALGDYDHTQPLVIDPVLTAVSFFDGNADDVPYEMALLETSTNAFIFVAGHTFSTDLATSPVAVSNHYAGGSKAGGDAFVAKFDATKTTSNLVYLTYLGGSSHDSAFGLAVDSEGNAYVTGFTASTNFPARNFVSTNINSQAVGPAGLYPLDAFVTKISASGSNIVYSGFLGGSDLDDAFAIAVDNTGAAYVTGFTESTNFPTANTSFTNYTSGGDVFVTKIAPDGLSYVYSLILGGTNTDRGEGIAVNSAGEAFVTGFTRSPTFPITTNIAFQSLHNSQTNPITSADAFLMKIGANGNLDYSSFFGGLRDEIGYSVTLDSQQNVYLCGTTVSTNFYRTPSSITNFLAYSNLLSDAFLTKFDSTLTNVAYSIAFGGAARDDAWDVAVDSRGRAHVVGVTYSSAFPVTNNADFLLGSLAGSGDVFVTEFNEAGTALTYSGYVGGTELDAGHAVKCDAIGDVWFAGETASAGSTLDGFVFKITLDSTLTITNAGENVQISWPAFAPEYGLESRAGFAATNFWSALVAEPVIIGGRHVITLPPTNGASYFRLRFQ